METLSLQLVTVDLDNGQRGVFVGAPLVTEYSSATDCNVEEIWFSAISEVRPAMTIGEIMELVRDHIAGQQSAELN